MLKNVKIPEEIHRAMSVKAARLGVHKSDLSAALMKIGLESADQNIMKEIYEIQATFRNPEYPNPD